MDFLSFVKMALGILSAIIAWLWKLVKSNLDEIAEHKTEIALLQQKLDSQDNRVDGINEKVEKLGEDMNAMKFELIDIKHNQENHFASIMHELQNLHN